MAYTEFYCQSGGSNLNAGSTTNNSAAYTSTNGNWNGTSTFTPSDTQAASLIAVGDFASVYNDGASVGVYIARVVTINSTGGNITSIVLSTSAKAGTAPTSSATGRSIKVGGAWKGPNATSGFPFSLATLGSATNSSTDRTRVNLKNDATYSVTSSISSGNLANVTIQGYSSSVNDGGKAVIDGSTNAIVVFNVSGGNLVVLADLEIKSSATSGTNDVVQFAANPGWIARCVVHGGRGN